MEVRALGEPLSGRVGGRVTGRRRELVLLPLECDQKRPQQVLERLAVGDCDSNGDDARARLVAACLTKNKTQ
jgi:hypothetical protein